MFLIKFVGVGMIGFFNAEVREKEVRRGFGGRWGALDNAP